MTQGSTTYDISELMKGLTEEDRLVVEYDFTENPKKVDVDELRGAYEE